MKTYQQRVVEECTELQLRTKRLAEFITSSPVYLTLPPAEKERLAIQHDLMEKLILILRERIAAF